MHSDLVTFIVAMTKYAKEELTGRRLYWGSQLEDTVYQAHGNS